MVSIGMYITELLRSGGLRMMNRKFIFVGLVLAMFVFPYVLNIEESEAAGEVVDDPKSCTFSANPTARIVCLSNQLRQAFEKFNKLNKHLQETQADLSVCHANLQTFGTAHEAANPLEETHCTSTAPPSKHSPTPQDTRLSPYINLLRNHQEEIKANVQNFIYLLNEIERLPNFNALSCGSVKAGRCVGEYQRTKQSILNSLARISECTKALKTNEGC